MEVAELLDEDQHWKEDLIYKHSGLEDVEACKFHSQEDQMRIN